ncbi:hypothetical protein H1R20_g15871, partial [Candolleomyces eurysporus]
MLTKAATGAAITACLALLVQLRHREQNTLASKVQKRQSKDEATIAELREHLSRLEAQLRSASAQNHTLTEEYEARSLSTQESIDTLPEDLSSARRREDQCHATIAELEAARAEEETTIADLRQELLTLEAQVLSTSAQNHTLTEENEKYGDDSLSEDLSNAREKVAQHNATIIDLEEGQAEDETTIADLLQQLSTLSAPLLSASHENRAFTEENKEYESTSLSMKQESIDTLPEDPLSAREEVAQYHATITYLKEAQAEDESTIAALRQQLSTLEAQLSSTNDENRALKEEKKEYDASSPSRQESINTLSEDLSSAREEVTQNNATTTDLKEAQAEDKSTIADLRQQLLTLEARLLSTNDKNHVLTEEKKEYEASSLSMQKVITTLSEDLASAIKRVAQRGTTITDLREGQAEDETTIAVLLQQLSTLEASLLSANDKIRALTEGNKEYEAISLSKQESINALYEDLSSAREEVAQHNTTITDLNKAQAQDKSTIAGLQQQLSTLEKRLLLTSDENLALAEENKECKTDSLSLQEVSDILSEDLLSARREVDQHHAMITGLEKVRAKDKTTIADLRQQVSKLKKRLLSTIAENRALGEKNEADSLSTQKSIDTLSKDLSSARQEVDQHNATITHLKAAQAKCEAKNDKLREKLVAVSAENVSMSARSLTLVEENASRLAALQQELEQKTKAAAYWKDLYTRSHLDTAQSQQARRGREESKSDASETEPSPTGIIPRPNQEIAQLGAAYRCQ